MKRTPVKSEAKPMIDARLESLITLDDAAKFAPGYRPGQCASTAAVRRWAHLGMRGVRLETLIAGGRRCTSREAVQRFFESLTAARESQVTPPRRRKPTAQEIERRRINTRLALRERHSLLQEVGST